MWLKANSIAINLDNILAIKKEKKDETHFIQFFSGNGHLDLDFPGEEERDRDFDLIMKELK